MRPDRRKRNRGRNAERLDDGGVQERKNDGKNDSKSEDAQKTKPEETPGKTDQDKAATNVSSVANDQNENQPAPALRRETDALKETKKFSKRQIFSNWEKYDEPIVQEVEEESQNDFGSLIQRNFSGDEHFKFKCERQWERESCSMNQDLFTLNLEQLSAGLECIPYYKRLNLPKYFFSENELQRMHKIAKNQKKLYEKLLKGEVDNRAETIIASLLGKFKENTDEQLVDETKASPENQNQEVAFIDMGEFMMKDSTLESSEGFWNENQMNENFSDENQFNEQKANQNKLDERKIYVNQLEQRKVDMNKLDERKVDMNQLVQKKVDMDKLDERKVDMNQLEQRKVDMNKLDERKIDMNQLDERKANEIKFCEKKVHESLLNESKENDSQAVKSKANKNEVDEIKINANKAQAAEVTKNKDRGTDCVTDQRKAIDNSVLINSNIQNEAQALPARAKTVRRDVQKEKSIESNVCRRDVEKEKSIESNVCVESLPKERVVKKDEPLQVPEMKVPPKTKGAKSKNASKVKSLGEDEEILDSLLSLKEPAISPIDMTKKKVEEEENEADNLVTDVTSIVIHEKKENLEDWLDSMLDD